MENNTQKHPLNGKKIALMVVYALIAICLLITILSLNDLPGIINQLKTVNMGYVFAAIGMILVYLALYPISLCLLTKAKQSKVKMSTTYVIAMTEHFFNGITPLATGGQPFQAHSFSRAKIKISESTGLLLTNLLIYMMVTTGYSLTGLFFFDTLTASIDPWWIPIIIIGYSLNFMVLVVTFLLGTSKKIRDLMMRFIYFLCKFKIFKMLSEKTDDIQEYFEQVQDAFHMLTQKKGYFVLAVLSKILSFAFLYSSTFFILQAMNIPVALPHLFLVLSGTSFAITAVGFIPTPGASGGVEGSAGQVFKCIILFLAGNSVLSTATATANGVMLIWRLVSYYLVMVISLLFYIGLEIYFTRQKKRNCDRETD